jgi:hypothetical protein
MDIKFQEKNIELVQGETTSLFFHSIDNFGNGINLSGGNASLVIKRYPTSPRIFFFMDNQKAFHGGTQGEFIYSSTADANGVGVSEINQDIQGNTLTGGIVFPIYGGDSDYIPKGVHFYEVSVRDSQERKMAFEGRIDVYTPSPTGTTFEAQQKNIEIVQDETTNLFFKHTDNYGNGIDLTDKKALLIARRYPSNPNTILDVNEQRTIAGDSNGTHTEISSASGGTFSFVNTNLDGTNLTGGIKFYIPAEATSVVPFGRYFYEVSISGSSEKIKIFEGRMDVITKFYTIPLTVTSQ